MATVLTIFPRIDLPNFVQFANRQKITSAQLFQGSILLIPPVNGQHVCLHVSAQWVLATQNSLVSITLSWISSSSIRLWTYSTVVVGSTSSLNWTSWTSASKRSTSDLASTGKTKCTICTADISLAWRNCRHQISRSPPTQSCRVARCHEIFLLAFRLKLFELNESVYGICHALLSYDQLWAASLTGRNAVTWRWALSYFTTSRSLGVTL